MFLDLSKLSHKYFSQIQIIFFPNIIIHLKTTKFSPNILLTKYFVCQQWLHTEEPILTEDVYYLKGQNNIHTKITLGLSFTFLFSEHLNRTARTTQNTRKKTQKIHRRVHTSL